MAGKAAKGTNRLENDIFKCRDESNWKKIQELAEQLMQRGTGPQSEAMASFFIGESKLEQFLEEHPPTEANINKAKTGLTEAKRYLNNCFTEHGAKAGVTTDGHFLLAKLLYAQGFYEEAITHLDSGGIDRLEEKSLSNRILKILAESFAIKGLCLEKVPLKTTSKTKAANREDQIVSYFVQASDLALKYLQEVEKSQGTVGGVVPTGTAVGNVSTVAASSSPLPPNTEYRIGTVLENVLQRAPLLMIKSGKLRQAIDQYRNVLRAEETSSTQSLRQTMSRQLAEVLLRGVCETNYIDYEPRIEIKKQGKHWRPNKYSGQSLFMPKTEYEEILLLLFISEAMAVRNAVLDRSPEFQDARVHSYNSVVAVYDLLVFVLARMGQFQTLCESFERAMKFSFEEYHVWMQFSLSLLSSGKHLRATLMLKECARLQPHNSFPCLLAAKVCLENLGNVEQGVEFAEEALNREKRNPQSLLAQCHLVLGVGYALMAEQRRPQSKRAEFKASAFQCFLRAQSADPYFHLPEYHLALHYAEVRQLSKAVSHARRALELNPEHVHTLHLLALLLSAQKQHGEALQLINATLDEYPNYLNLMYTKAHLEDYCLGPEEALLTSKQMLLQWKTFYESELKSDYAQTGLQRVTSCNRGSFHVRSGDFSDRESGQSIAAATRVEQALSEALQTGAGPLAQPQPQTGTAGGGSTMGLREKRGSQTLWLLQLQVWLLIAELYLKMEQLSEAEACILEASNIYPLSHQLMVMKGLLHEMRKEYYDAKTCFQNAVSINPLHVTALQHLGLVYHYLGSSQLAEKTLRDAVAIDPMCHQSWFNMGKVLQETGDFDSATDCLNTAIQLEMTTPILPFSTVPRTLE
ncbi:tetratricopeptide repeat domain 7 [Rhipicephalus microplus]|uniref:tetratricopeptide repeat domain 7 n=1 Tax=Rhipicephalus microplus TaxID=6941 RepID=UPI002F2B0DDF